jgi:MFS family permease
MREKSKYRWFVVSIFFIFMLLHQSDRLLIAPMTSQIMDDFKINEAQMGAVVTGALLVGAVLYPLWGVLYDRYARPKLLALAAGIWGATTWLSAVAPTYRSFLAARATTGIDDSTYPGLYSLLSDYFGPQRRGKIYGLLQLTQPLGYMIGLIAATLLAATIGWRKIFYITGAAGLLLAILIFFTVRETPRGASEPELAELATLGVYRFDWKVARDLINKPTLLLLFAQGFVGVFPWNVITFWFFRYLEVERDYDPDAILFTLAPTILILAAGYFIGGLVGDYAFRKNNRGRLITALFGVLAGALFLALTMNVPSNQQLLFSILMGVTALFMPFAASNVVASVHDITLPEVRSTALAVQLFIENGGAAVAPLLAGLIAVRASLHTAILAICISAWLIGALLIFAAIRIVPRDIHVLRTQMQARARDLRTGEAA